jgi:hypothetical protein
MSQSVPKTRSASLEAHPIRQAAADRMRALRLNAASQTVRRKTTLTATAQHTDAASHSGRREKVRDFAGNFLLRVPISQIKHHTLRSNKPSIRYSFRRQQKEAGEYAPGRIRLPSLRAANARPANRRGFSPPPNSTSKHPVIKCTEEQAPVKCIQKKSKTAYVPKES